MGRIINLRNTVILNKGDFLLDLHRSLAHQGSVKILDISTPMSFRGGFRELLCIKISAHLFAKKSLNLDNNLAEMKILKKTGER